MNWPHKDNLTRTRVSGTSSKSVRRQTRRSKKSSNLPGYLASDESMLIPSDISDTSEWEWIAGGFPCRDVARERFTSDSRTTHIPNGIAPNFSLTKNDIKSEILEDNIAQYGDQFGDQTSECPISIIPANRTSSALEQNTTPQVEEETIIKPRELQDDRNPTDSDTVTDFPVYEIVDSADDCTSTHDSSNKPGNVPPIIRRSSRNVGPPKFYGQRYFIDAVDISQETSGSAANPIVVEIDDNTTHKADSAVAPADLILIDSDSPSPEQTSTSSTDESLRMAVDNFGEHSELDSELLMLNLKTF